MNFFLFSNRGKDARIEEGTTGDEAERCEVRKSAAVVAGMGMGWGGVKVQCESPLSNGAFSHQHRPHCVCGAREHSGGSAGTREGRGDVTTWGQRAGIQMKIILH